MGIVPLLLAVQVAGEIRGQVVDPTGASVGNAIVRVVSPESDETLQRTQTNNRGDFQFTGIEAGRYVVRAQAVFFSEIAVEDVSVRQREVADVGRISLTRSGCDSPHVICDDFAINSPRAPVRRAPLRNGDLTLHVGCAADFDKANVECPPGPGADLLFAAEKGHLYLKPINGAKLSQCAETATSFEVVRTFEAVRISGLGAWNAWCVETRDGTMAHIFIDQPEVDPSADQVKIWHATR